MANICWTKHDTDNQARALESAKGLLRCCKISWTLVHKWLTTGPEVLPTLTIYAIASGGLKWQYIAIIATFSSLVFILPVTFEFLTTSYTGLYCISPHAVKNVQHQLTCYWYKMLKQYSVCLSDNSGHWVTGCDAGSRQLIMADIQQTDSRYHPLQTYVHCGCTSTTCSTVHCSEHRSSASATAVEKLFSLEERTASSGFGRSGTKRGVDSEAPKAPRPTRRKRRDGGKYMKGVSPAADYRACEAS